MIRVKICGITNYKDAIDAYQAGADALGFVFYKESPRYVKPFEAKNIIDKLPPFIIKVGVVVNANLNEIKKFAEQKIGLNAIQLHGDLNEYSNIKFINELKKFFHLIRCFPVENEKDVKKALDFKNVLIPLFDCKTELFGGSGKIFDWNLLKKYRNKFEFFILAGGLNSENVKDAIKIVKPPVVDVSSGVELKPGRKDKMKMIKFIKSVKSFD